jgi:hypothetical protein
MHQDLRYIIDERCHIRGEETHAVVRGRMPVSTPPSDQFLYFQYDCRRIEFLNEAGFIEMDRYLS